MTIYSTDDAFGVKAKCFNEVFTCVLALFFLLSIANKSHFYAPNSILFVFFKVSLHTKSIISFLPVLAAWQQLNLAIFITEPLINVGICVI